MIVKIKPTKDSRVFYYTLEGWAVEVQEETVTKLFNIPCAERYVLTDNQVNKLMEMFGGQRSYYLLLPTQDATECKDTGDIDYDNFHTDIMNTAKRHGFRFSQLDYCKI